MGGGSKKSSSSGAASPWLVAKTLAICTAIGFAGGWIMPFIQIPFVSCLISFALGLAAGKWLAKILDHRLGHRVGIIVVFGLLIGLSLSPFGALAPMVVQMFASPLTGDFRNVIGDLNGLVNLIFCPVCFIVGVLRPSIWGLPF